MKTVDEVVEALRKIPPRKTPKPRKRDPEKAKGYFRQWYLEHRAQVIATSKAWRANNAEWARELGRIGYHRRNARYRRYGLTIEQYGDMFVGQGGRCANSGCRAAFDDVVRPEIDHCHETQQVRGLLCRGCNSGLGHTKDNIDRLLGLVEYLRRLRP